MIISFLLGFLVMSAVLLIGGLITENTNLGAGLAAGVKGRPYVPFDNQE